jgi:glycerol-3-phosphate dehydrogenase (NAD(P)+)
VKITVVGAGAFGTAMAVVAARCGQEVLIWAHDPAVADEINRERTNQRYLPEASFDTSIAATSDLHRAANFSETLIMVVPSHHYRSVLGSIGEHLSRPVRIVSATKGIENESLERMSQVSAGVLGEKLDRYAALSGPTFAVESVRGDPTTAVIASTDPDFATEIQRIMSDTFFRLYRSDDVVGVELAGSLKNIIAIAAGAVEGLGFGSNTNAALVTRGLHEIRRLGLALGGRPETFAGLAGMGDLVLTCTGSLSRNRRVGADLGRGKLLLEILDETKFVAEGVRTCKSAKELSDRHGIEMPITTEMFRVLYENEPPRAAVLRLMSRSLKAEMGT